jgi:hypothetical protein
MNGAYLLRAEIGPQAGTEFPLPPAGVTIGREAGNTLVLEDQQVSRHHAQVTLHGDTVLITDLGASNGTLINGQRIVGTAPIRLGDTLQIGATILRLLPNTTGTAHNIAPGPFQGASDTRREPGRPQRPNRLPLILGGLAGLLLLVCACGGIGLIAVTRQVSTDAARDKGETPASTVRPAETSALAPISGARGPSQPRPGYATGTILDQHGQPIKVGRVQAQLLGVSQAGEKIAIDLPVDATGRYEGQIPAGNYSVVARLVTSFGGKPFTFELDPVGGKLPDQSARNGVVRDFRWKLAGPRPERSATSSSPYDRYGFRLKVLSTDSCSPINPAPNCKLPENLQATLTLTPVGPLIDGSPGQPVTMALTGGQLNKGFTAEEDLPLATYRITVATTTSGTPRPLLVSASPTGASPATPTAATVDLTPTPDGSIIHEVTVQITAGT